MLLQRAALRKRSFTAGRVGTCMQRSGQRRSMCQSAQLLALHAFSMYKRELSAHQMMGQVAGQLGTAWGASVPSGLASHFLGLSALPSTGALRLM